MYHQFSSIQVTDEQGKETYSNIEKQEQTNLVCSWNRNYIQYFNLDYKHFLSCNKFNWISALRTKSFLCNYSTLVRTSMNIH